MHAAQRARRNVEGDVRLGDYGLEPLIGELVLTERAREVAARILTALQVDDEGARQRRLGEDHVVPLPPNQACAATGARHLSSASNLPSSSSVFRRDKRTNRSPENVASSIASAR